MKFETKDYVVEYPDDIETQKEIFNRVIQFFIGHESFCGESIVQSDGCLIDGPELLAEIADDILKFKVDYK